MTQLRKHFLKYLCQTSSDPIGLEIDRAEDSYIYTTDGRRYLDFLAGISVANIGHAHPEVVKAICEQAQRHLHVMVYGEYIQTQQVLLARRLASILPASLSSVYFTNSGTEAVEGALKLAKKYTRQTQIISFHGSYHGDTHGSLSVTGREVYKTPFYPLLPEVSFLPFNDTAALKQIDPSVAAVIVEPIQGEGGVILPKKQFLPMLRNQCRKAGALLIFDEAQTGLGRTGKLFAFERFNATPDILVLAKALGGGMPLGAFIASPKIMKCLSVDPPLSHVTTFGGHPVSCAAGLASLEIILKNHLADRAEKMGKKLRTGLTALAQKYAVIEEIRGVGMMIGLVFSDEKVCEHFVVAARRAGLLLGYTLHTNRTVRMVPPLTLSDEELREGLFIMDWSLACAAKGTKDLRITH